MGRREERKGREIIKEERERKEGSGYKGSRKGRGCIKKEEKRERTGKAGKRFCNMKEYIMEW